MASRSLLESIMHGVQSARAWLAELFDPGETPLPFSEHPVLGRSNWSEDDESWIGTYNGFTYSLGYDRTSTPPEDLCAYAIAMLGDTEGLILSVEAAKADAAKERSPLFTGEIQELTLDLIHFMRVRRRKYRFYTIADLKGGRDFRAWRIEYLDQQCIGIGFDS